MADDIQPQSAPDADDTQPISEDCPCFNCGHNLRGLKPSDTCPSCHEPVATTLNFIGDEILCAACMKPNPQRLTNCQFCGAPLNNAADITSYAAGKLQLPSSMLKVDDTPEDRLIHARRRMWIGLIFFGPMTLAMLPVVNLILHEFVFETTEAMKTIFASIVALLMLAIFVALLWLHYFLIRRYLKLKIQLARTDSNNKQHS